MPLPDHINDREFQSFRDTGVAGQTKKAVVVEQSDPIPIVGPLIRVAYDSVYASYPDSVTEIYEFKESAATVATVTVVYTDSTKENLSSAVRT